MTEPLAYRNQFIELTASVMKDLNTIWNNWGKSQTIIFYLMVVGCSFTTQLLLLTDKLKLKCYVLYETKELFSGW